MYFFIFFQSLGTNKPYLDIKVEPCLPEKNQLTFYHPFSCKVYADLFWITGPYLYYKQSFCLIRFIIYVQLETIL